MHMRVNTHTHKTTIITIIIIIITTTIIIIQCVRKDAAHSTPPDYYLWRAAKSAAYRDRPRTLNELKTAITANISQAHLQKVFSNKIKRVQACIDARGHHFQHLS
jgi:hypothetical protein